MAGAKASVCVARLTSGFAVLAVLALLALLAGLSQPDAAADEKRILRGRVHDADVQRLNRPVTPGIGQSVSILSGGSAARASDNPLVRAETEQDVIDLSLKNEHFNLPKYKKQTAKSAWLPETSVELGARHCCSEVRIPEEVYFDEMSIPGWGRAVRKRRGRAHTFPVAQEWSINRQSVSGRLASSETETLLDPGDYDRIPQMTPIPQIRMPAFTPIRQYQTARAMPVYEDKYITWDQWYKQVADSLWKQWRQGGNAEPGEADLRITVDKSGKVEAKILTTNNLNLSFKKSILAAAAALSGSPILQFPSQSQRYSVSFDTHFSAGVGTVPGASSQRANEIERTRIRH